MMNDHIDAMMNDNHIDQVPGSLLNLHVLRELKLSSSVATGLPPLACELASRCAVNILPSVIAQAARTPSDRPLSERFLVAYPLIAATEAAFWRAIAATMAG